jgi:hypothetical protein
MASDQDFTKFLQDYVLRKRWDEIRDSWAPYLSKSINAFEEENDYRSMQDVIAATSNLYSSEDKDSILNVNYIQPFVLREGIILLHKASNVISAAQADILKGYKTWSLVNAYHGSHFAAKSILCFLGITFPLIEVSEGKQNLIMLDIWPGLIKTKNVYQGLKLGSTESTLFARPPITKLDQRHIWQALQRYLNVMTLPHPNIWPNDYPKVIKTIDYKGFGKQRNYLFYTNNAWLFDDLLDFEITPNWGVINEDFFKKYREVLKDLESDFSITCSLLLLKMAFQLFESICADSRILEDDLNKIKTILSSEQWHPLYLKCVF